MIEIFFKQFLLPIISGVVAALIVERRCTKNFENMKSEIEKITKTVAGQKPEKEAADWLEKHLEELAKRIADKNITQKDVEEYLFWIRASINNEIIGFDKNIPFPIINGERVDKQTFLRTLELIQAKLKQLYFNEEEINYIDIVVDFIGKKLRNN
jgi:hypothetical protein